jgi:TonB family protein
MRPLPICLALCVGCISTAAQAQTRPAQPFGTHECDDVQHTADAKRLSGVTLLKMQIGVDGAPRDISVEKSSGDAEMDKLAVACVADWKYRPAIQDGRPVAAAWYTRVAWNAPANVGAPVPTPFVPDVVHLEPRIHRLGVDTHMYAQVSAILKLAAAGQTWRCRQVFFDISGEHHIRHWIAQGWDDSDDFMYARTENGHYVAVHIKSDGTFIAALEMDDATGMGKGLDYPAVADFLKQEVVAWNASVAEK